MAITLKRQLTPEEKAIILQRHGRVCFATGHAIAEEESLHYDHIMAFALGGRSELDNIAPMCEVHNKAKGMLPLEDFRVSLQLQEFFRTGDRLTLKHLLQFLKTQNLAAGYATNRRLKDWVILKVTEQVEYLVENQETRLQSELVVFVIVTVEEFNRQSRVKVFPVRGWAMEKVISEVSVR